VRDIRKMIRVREKGKDKHVDIPRDMPEERVRELQRDYTMREIGWQAKRRVV
jgi:hypothetical protein